MSDIELTTPVVRPQLAKRKDHEDGAYDQPKHHDAPEDDAPEGDARDIDVQISLMGIEPEHLPDDVRDALGKVWTEFDRQREELERLRLRAAFLEQQHDRDAVLPVGGRMALLRRLSRALHRSEQSALDNTLVVFHVDGIDALRRDRGAAVAERVMIDFATRIQATLDETDFLASLGGYDLGLLLPLVERTAAEAKAVDLARLLEAAPEPDAEQAGVVLTVLWGCAAFVDHGDPAALIEAADRDMLARR